MKPEKPIGTTCKCMVCGHIWESRVAKPAACPACKRYDWEKGKR